MADLRKKYFHAINTFLADKDSKNEGYDLGSDEDDVDHNMDD